MRNRCNTPSGSPQKHYKRAVAIPLLDSFINQLEERFGGEKNNGHVLLCLISSVFLTESFSKELPEQLELLFWELDLPCSKSLGSELRRWQSLWQEKSKMKQVFLITSFQLLVLVMLTPKHPLPVGDSMHTAYYECGSSAIFFSPLEDEDLHKVYFS